MKFDGLRIPPPKCQRHVEELLGFDDHSDVGRFCLNQRYSALHCYAFRYCTHGETDIDGCRLIGLNLNSALNVRTEAVRFRCQVIDTDRKADEAIRAGIRADRIESIVGSSIYDFECDVGNCRPGTIDDNPCYRAAISLRQQGDSNSQLIGIRTGPLCPLHSKFLLIFWVAPTKCVLMN